MNYKDIIQEDWSNDENVVQAIKWVVRSLLGNSKKRVYNEYNVNLFIKNGLESLTKEVDIYKALERVYPNRFKINKMKERCVAHV